MFFPSKSEFKRLGRSGYLIPLCKVIEPDSLTPLTSFERISQKDKYSYLLESARTHPQIGHYSFLGFEPELVFKSKGERVDLEYLISGVKKERKTKDPLGELKKLMSKYKAVRIDGLPNFVGGAVGYLSYDLCHFFENLPRTIVDDLMLPDIFFIVSSKIVAFDHLKDRMMIIVNAGGRDLNKAYEKAREKIEEIEERLRRPPTTIIPHSAFRTPHSASPVQSTFTKREYERMVKRCKEYIKAGDIFQANLSQRLSFPFKGDPWELYRCLREINPSPFACYLSFDKLKIVSCSPERLLRVQGRKVETRPIAGTRPRGENRLEDEALAKELILNEKERAEHIMLVDLERNDLGRVCEYGSVKVDEMMVTESYSHVFHIVSNVCGVLRKDKDKFDLIKACFPGGTITGCPKVRCMEIIDELEKVARGIYTGSIGYLSYSGDMDLNIVIRTFAIKDGKAYLSVGGGIVADSDPEREYYETLYKAEALIKALEKVSGVKIKGLKIKKFKPEGAL